jgi:hypothetical protein
VSSDPLPDIAGGEAKKKAECNISGGDGILAFLG